MPAVALEPGEDLRRSEFAGCAFGRRGVSTLRRNFSNLIGEAFLTDRRLVFIPYRMSMRFRPIWISLREIAAVAESSASMISMVGRRAFDISSRDGATLVLWLKDDALISAVRETLVHAESIPPTTSNLASPDDPGKFAVIWGLAIAGGFTIMILATEGREAFRIPMLGLMCLLLWILFVATAVRVFVRMLRAGKPSPPAPPKA
jgi:hypothetical protein